MIFYIQNKSIKDYNMMVDCYVYIFTVACKSGDCEYFGCISFFRDLQLSPGRFLNRHYN